MSMTVQNNPVHNQPQVQVPVDPSQVQNQGAADKIAADALSIISGANLMVQDNLRTDPTKRVANTGKAVDIDEVPELDDEDVKAMLAILDERKKGPFTSFADLASRVTSLKQPEAYIARRIIDEIASSDHKHFLFVPRDAPRRA